jgi:uncharacterized protein (TIGR02757 family)
MTRRRAVGPLLEQLYREVDGPARRASDPVAFVHRYTDPADQEVAGVFAASLAFGRVAAFQPVLQSLFDATDAHGGPARVAAEVPDALARAWEPLFYRWLRGPHLVALLRAVGEVRERHGGLEAPSAEGSLREGLSVLVDALREVVEVDQGPRAEWARGLRYLLPSPADGSACKRWCMFARWMVRPPVEGIDLGLWRRDPATLVVPVDTHVLKLARFLGLTERSDGSWRTAEDITASLRRIDPVDPVRFDFALAHLGISGACRGHRVPEVCRTCALDAACRAPRRPSAR